VKATQSPRRILSSPQLEFVAIGGAIGSGLFVGSSEGLHTAGPSLLLAYAVCGIVVYFIARCLAEMSLARDARGTFVDHVRWQLGPRLGFVCGWTFWFTLVLIGMAELTAIGLLLRLWFPAAAPWMLVALVLVCLLAFNSAPVSYFGKSELWLSIVKIGAIAVFIALGLAAAIVPNFLHLSDARFSNLWRYGGAFPTGVGGFVIVLPVALFAFGGFEVVGLAAAEARQPQRSLPRAVNGLIARLIIFYLGATAALLVLLPWPEVTPGTSPFVVVLQRMHLPFAATLMNAVLITAVLSSCNAIIFSATRTLRSLALAVAAPRPLAALNGNGTPATAAAFTVAAMSLAVVLDSIVPKSLFGILMQSVSILTAVTWALIVLAAMRFRMRNTSGALSYFPVPWAPWSNVVVLAFLVSVVVLLARSAVRPVFLLACAVLVILAVLSLFSKGPSRGTDTVHESASS